eukprot:UN30508
MYICGVGSSKNVNDGNAVHGFPKKQMKLIAGAVLNGGEHPQCPFDGHCRSENVEGGFLGMSADCSDYSGTWIYDQVITKMASSHSAGTYCVITNNQGNEEWGVRITSGDDLVYGTGVLYGGYNANCVADDLEYCADSAGNKYGTPAQVQTAIMSGNKKSDYRTWNIKAISDLCEYPKQWIRDAIIAVGSNPSETNTLTAQVENLCISPTTDEIFYSSEGEGLYSSC